MPGKTPWAGWPFEKIKSTLNNFSFSGKLHNGTTIDVQDNSGSSVLKINESEKSLTVNGLMVGKKAVVSLSDADATLTAAQLTASGIFTITPTAARTLTTATAAQVIAALPDYNVGTSFEFTIVVLAAQTVTLAAGSGVTLVGAATANNSSATFRGIVTSSSAVSIYRM